MPDTTETRLTSAEAMDIHQRALAHLDQVDADSLLGKRLRKLAEVAATLTPSLMQAEARKR